MNSCGYENRALFARYPLTFTAMFAEHFAWTDKLADGMDFEYYENPRRR